MRDQPVFYTLLKYALLGPWLKVGFMPRIVGRDNVPTSGGVLLAGNHLSYLDWLFVPNSLPRMVRYAAKTEYFEGRDPMSRFQTFFFTNTGNVPIDRAGATAAEGAMITAKRILDEGHIFGIYPEGTRSPDGRLYRGKTGVARIALDAGVPVIPVAVAGTNRIAPPGKILGGWARPTVIFGAPIDLSAYVDRKDDRAVQREVTDLIMDRIQELSGQEYVADTYAGARRATLRRRSARRPHCEVRPPLSPRASASPSIQ